MTKDQEIASAQAAAGRLFRVYERHCRGPNLDTLYETLTALHSLNDRLKKATSRDLHDIEEFIALKALRNFAHHEDEVHANVCVIPAPAYSDLLFMCIVRRDQVERAIGNVDKKWRDASRAACEACFHWYVDAVNINPALFNVIVHVYELLPSVAVESPADDVASLRDSYDFEAENGHSHFIDGRLTMNAAELPAVLSKVVADLPSVPQ